MLLLFLKLLIFFSVIICLIYFVNRKTRFMNSLLNKNVNENFTNNENDNENDNDNINLNYNNIHNNKTLYDNVVSESINSWLNNNKLCLTEKVNSLLNIPEILYIEFKDSYQTK